MLDDRTVLREDINRAEHLLWSPENNRLGWELYLHQPVSSAPLPPYAAAARRADLSGLPPAWIGVGTLDLFYEEDLAYAQRLKDSGVTCETAVVPGAFHGFDQFGPRFQVVRDFRAAQVSALRKYLFGD
jgi:acetyl esterase/lipase